MLIYSRWVWDWCEYCCTGLTCTQFDCQCGEDDEFMRACMFPRIPGKPNLKRNQEMEDGDESGDESSSSCNQGKRLLLQEPARGNRRQTLPTVINCPPTVMTPVAFFGWFHHW